MIPRRWFTRPSMYLFFTQTWIYSHRWLRRSQRLTLRNSIWHDFDMPLNKENGSVCGSWPRVVICMSFSTSALPTLTAPWRRRIDIPSEHVSTRPNECFPEKSRYCKMQFQLIIFVPNNSMKKRIFGLLVSVFRSWGETRLCIMDNKCKALI